MLRNGTGQGFLVSNLEMQHQEAKLREVSVVQKFDDTFQENLRGAPVDRQVESSTAPS